MRREQQRGVEEFTFADIFVVVGGGRFDPSATCTRAQIVTFLWRAAGSPDPKSRSFFSDVSADSYYA